MESRANKPRRDACFYGSVTVGERGQIVIPAEARKEIGILPGDKLLIWKHPSEEGLMLFKIESVREFMSRMLESLEHAERHPEEEMD
ncbi:MAG TPA: AbrB/MazE/SpoVT family DNA-binding domain-containing protein [Chthonomonadaceae bacterium]|nr:AbrB/MazE/SpoVT family DNA-binding domain-containing protein [Chthonomonadaceae bacterium]